jgi:quercetin dioxygenase-like cupin family protein
MELEWNEVQPGAWMAILHGDPGAPDEVYTVRFRTEAAIDVPAHFHPRDEHITVLAGPFASGFGNSFDAAVLKLYEAGGYQCVPAEVPHFARYSPGTIVQVTGLGPFLTTYLTGKS